jgi:hypothetical protein
MNKVILTASRLETKQRCDMKEFYTYNEGYRPAKISQGLAVGSMVHKGLEAFWNQKDFYAAVQHMKESMEEEPLYWEGPQGELSERLSILYLEGYYKKYYSLFKKLISDGDIRDIEVEKEFRLTIGDYEFAGKMDALYRNKDGSMTIVEHKTSGRAAADDDGPFWSTLPMNIQMTIYKKAVDEIYGRPTGEQPKVLYDVIMTTSKRPGQKRPYVRKGDYDTTEGYEAAKVLNVEAPTEFIKRITPDYMGDDSDQYKRQYIWTTEELYERRFQELIMLEKSQPSWRGESMRRRSTNSCNDYGSCPFIRVCLGTQMLDSPDFVKNEKTNPELSSKGN